MPENPFVLIQLIRIRIYLIRYLYSSMNFFTLQLVYTTFFHFVTKSKY